MTDRRVSPRYKANIPVTIEIMEGQNPVQRLDGLATTVSETGITLVVGQVPSEKNGIFFKFILPGNHTLITAQGSIIWHSVNTDTQKEAFGCYFYDMNIFETNAKGTPSPPPSPLKGEGDRGVALLPPYTFRGNGVYGRGRNRFENIFQELAPERRSSDCRKNINIDYQSERRSLDRRSANNLLDRIARSGKSLKRWESSWTYFRVVQSASKAQVIVDNAEKIMLGSNNYLGLTTHPAVKKAASEALEKYGTGAGGAPVLSGTMDSHVELARRLAEFKGTEDCVLFSSGFAANTALFPTLLRAGDAVFIDERSHASIIDGCRMSSADIHFYAHEDMRSLEKKLASSKNPGKLIATDSVFSMDGDIAPLNHIYELAKKYKAAIMIDDAHAIGVIGKTGRGLDEHFGLVGKIDFIVVTFSKALGSIGGAICCSRVAAEYFRTQARGFIFSTHLPPSVCSSVIAAIDIMESHPELVEKLRKNVSFTETNLGKLDYNVLPTQSAILAVIIGDELKSYELARALDQAGVFVNAISRPAVPRKLSRIRVSLMATHTEEHLEFVIDAFAKEGKKLGII